MEKVDINLRAVRLLSGGVHIKKRYTLNITRFREKEYAGINLGSNP
jgi:hypothetical protein